jgi:nucleotide-binding universal stress UspA family protein
MNRIEAVLVATDLHEKSDGALRYGAYLADMLEATVVVVHVVSSRDLDLDDVTHQQDHLGARALHHAEVDLSEQVKRVLGERPATTEIRFGDPALEVIAAAQEHRVGMIVVTVESRSRIGKLLLGSHAQQVLLESPVPVVGVKPSWTVPV